MVDVVDEGIERAHTLLESRLQRPPLILGDDARDDVEGNQPLGVTAFAVDGESDADAVENRIGLGAFGRQDFRRLAGEPRLVRAAMRTRGMVRIQHFVIGFGGGGFVRRGGRKLKHIGVRR